MIVHDELDLPTAALKVKAGGGLAGHNGLRSIKSHLHTRRVPARAHRRRQAAAARKFGADHVLDRFSKRDRKEIDVTIEDAADAVEMILERRRRRRDEPLQHARRMTGASSAPHP